MVQLVQANAANIHTDQLHAAGGTDGRASPAHKWKKGFVDKLDSNYAMRSECKKRPNMFRV